MSLGSLRSLPNFMLYEMTWDAERQRFKKMPCRLDGGMLGRGETPPTTTIEDAQRRLDSLTAGRYALGFWITDDIGVFFIDLDECVVDGQLDQTASAIAHEFVAAGAFFEPSSSGMGAHILGRYQGELPPHVAQSPKLHKHGFYTHSRGVVLNLDAAVGNADVDCTGPLHRMLPTNFPPREGSAVSMGTTRRPEWRGPEDDEELIRRMLSAKGSAAQRFGHKLSFADLWSGNAEKNNENDLALAAHLAFWTGADADRVERLMRRSGMARAKWDEHNTYLRKLTIDHACDTTLVVYKEPERASMVPAAVANVDWVGVVDQQITAINNAGNYRSLMEEVVPAIAAMQIPVVHIERVVTCLKKRMEIFDSKPPIAYLRRLLSPPSVERITEAAPEWFAPFVYIKSTDKFYNTLTGASYSHDSFRMENAKLMPIRQNGDREDPVKYARERWNIVTVDEIWYRPDKPALFDYAGKQFANGFIPSTMPTAVVPSEDCQQNIAKFQQHLYLLCDRRDDIYWQILWWLAHNIQKPGYKIRWSPMIKGIGGDGKSIIGELLFEAIGDANAKQTSISSLQNSGGFSDWATGKAVNIIEEIKIEGRDRHKLYNAIKIFIGDRRIDLNRKGKASGDTLINITNHIAFTNYEDAMPLDNTDRRWLIVFSPYSDISEVVAAHGLADISALIGLFKALGESMRREPGAWRAWLLGVDISAFDPDSRAIETEEKNIMRSMSEDPVEQAVKDILMTGGHGFTEEAFCSTNLWGKLRLECMANGWEIPRSSSWHKILLRCGYSQVGIMKWRGVSQRVWAKKKIKLEDVRIILDRTVTVPPT